MGQMRRGGFFDRYKINMADEMLALMASHSGDLLDPETRFKQLSYNLVIFKLSHFLKICLIFV